MNRLAVFLATAGGAGYAPVAPGTAGAAVGIVCYLVSRHWPPLLQAVFVLTLALVGVWASQRAARYFAREDPGPVVIDEVAGQLVTLFLIGGGVGAIVLGFFVFRVLDITKPWPAGALEALPGGWGIMADDLMAGLYGWMIMFAAMRFVPGWL